MRSWYEKKRWWSVGLLCLFFIWLGTNFIPYSFGGPAMSCVTAAHEANNDLAVMRYAKSVDGDPQSVFAYLHNSDFRFRNISRNGFENGVNLIFVNDKENDICGLLNAISIDGSIVKVQLDLSKGLPGKIVTGEE